MIEPEFLDEDDVLAIHDEALAALVAPRGCALQALGKEDVAAMLRQLGVSR